MAVDASTLALPRPLNPDGSPRRVGVEIEFDAPSLKGVCDLVREVFGGEIDFVSQYEATVTTQDGTFDVLADAKWALKLGHDRTAGEDGASGLTHEFLKRVADFVVPLEVATPPLQIAQLTQVDELVEKLAAQGAKGTKDSPFNAFGVHFNPELPSLEAEVILGYLRAFVVLHDWLLRTLEVDWSRRAMPFIDRYPRQYGLLILADSYAPTTMELIDDYLTHNPTRNRALDMLPLFAFLDEPRVRAVLPDEKINPRPTFHYRMGNSRVGDKTWKLTDEWHSWLKVENLANDEDRLRSLATEYQDILSRPLEALFTDWGARLSAAGEQR